jgi:hypothetical protein
MGKQAGRGGMGNHKHGTSGRATKSPRFRFLQKLEAEKDEKKPKSRKMFASLKEAFEGNKPS